MVKLSKKVQGIVFAGCALAAVSGLTSCEKKNAPEVVVSDAQAVLSQSSFYQGQQAPGATTAAATDDGYIKPPTTSVGAGDTGTIPNPTTTPPTPVAQDPATPISATQPPTPSPTTDPQVPVVINQPVETPPTTQPRAQDPGTVTAPTVGGMPVTDGGSIPAPGTGSGTPVTDNGSVPPPTNSTPPSEGGTVLNPPAPTTPPVTGGGSPAAPPTDPSLPPVTIPQPASGPVVGSNPPTDDGSVPPPMPGTTPGDDGEISTCDAASCPSVRVKLNRACSYMRSDIPYPKFIFFEEATTPVLAVEGELTLTKSSPILAMPGVFQMPSRSSSTQKVQILLQTIDLKGTDLIASPKTFDVKIALKAIKTMFPKAWSKMAIKFRVCNDANGNGQCSDEKGANVLAYNVPATQLSTLASQVVIDVWSGRHLNVVANKNACEKQISPLVLDLAGNGFKLVGPDSGVRFDIEATGDPVLTGWTSLRTDDAFLARDLDHNGNIDSGAELFGSATTLANGQRASNGFEALRELDSNTDGVFDERDAEYYSVKLWLDRNRDGIVGTAEVFGLAEAGVVSIQLAYVSIAEVDPYGNETRQRSTFVRRVGDKLVYRQIVDVWFNTIQNAYALLNLQP